MPDPAIPDPSASDVSNGDVSTGESSPTHSDPGVHIVAPHHLTKDVPGIGGAIKRRSTDFLVDEIPLYHPSGQGEHVYVLVEKRGLSTLEMVSVIARHFKVQRRAVGFAGLKDKRAITRQVVSVHTPGKSPADFPTLDHERVSILWADLHENKLKRGHLAGNRFSIRVRGVAPTAVQDAKRSLEILERTGVPNRIGPQRFGYLHNNHLIGRAIVLGEAQLALDLMLMPHPRSPEAQHGARELYAKGEYQDAFEAWPPAYRTERDALRALSRGQNADDALHAIDRTAASFYISSLQSGVFNDVLNRRLTAGTLGEVALGDVAFVHANRKTFRVGPEEVGEGDLAERVASFAVSPSGPMWGSRMTRGTGATDRAEVDALRAAEMIPADFERDYASALEMTEGARRPLRVPLRDIDVEGGVDEHGSYVRCAFELPRGSFATTVMDEVMKGDPLRAEELTDG